MNTILVVDDLAIFRDLLSHRLRTGGYRAVCACNGQEALAKLGPENPKLILLDVGMPVMDGLSFLQALRSNAKTAALPVILLTASTDKQCVMAAGKLGVRDYLIKSAFSSAELLERVRKYVAPAPAEQVAESRATRSCRDGESPASPPIAPPNHSPISSPASAPAAKTNRVTDSVSIPKLLSRSDCCHRAEEALQAKTLSGVVMQVVAMAASPRSDMAELATLIGRDPVLSARVLNAANSAAYSSSRGVISTIAEAVRNVGCSTIQNIAATLGIYEAMPQTSADGFNPIRCWQHSFGVATLAEQLLRVKHPQIAGTAYLAGLCHDLGDILFHTHFGAEYQRVVETEKRTGKPRIELERAMLGMTHGDLVLTILRCMGLPESIHRPIEMFHQAMEGKYAESKDPIARTLRLAELYANGILLAASGSSLVGPLSRVDCRGSTGEDNPVAPDSQELRSRVLALTGMLARLSASEEAQLMAPLYRPGQERIYVAREGVFSSFDPVAASLQSLGSAEVYDRLPAPGALGGYQKIVIISHSGTAPGFDERAIRDAIESAQSAGIKVLWLTRRAKDSANSAPPPAPLAYPTTLGCLADFVTGG